MGVASLNISQPRAISPSVADVLARFGEEIDDAPVGIGRRPLLRLRFQLLALSARGQRFGKNRKKLPPTGRPNHEPEGKNSRVQTACRRGVWTDRRTERRARFLSVQRRTENPYLYRVRPPSFNLTVLEDMCLVYTVAECNGDSRQHRYRDGEVDR